MIGAVLCDIGAVRVTGLTFVDPLPIQPFIEGTAVVEYAVQNNLHSAPMRFLHQLCKECIGSLEISLVCHALDVLGRMAVVIIVPCQRLSAVLHDLPVMGIDIVIVLNIVFMIRRGNKEGIKVDHLYAQSLQIVQFVINTLQIAAIETSHVKVRRILAPVRDVFHRHGDVVILSVHHVIGTVTVAKAIDQDLVHHRALGPVRRRKTGGDGKGILHPHFGTDTETIQITDLIVLVNLKIVGDLVKAQRNPRLVIVKVSVSLTIAHGIPGSVGTQEHIQGVSVRRPHPDPYIFIFLRLRRYTVGTGTIRK